MNKKNFTPRRSLLYRLQHIKSNRNLFSKKGMIKFLLCFLVFCFSPLVYAQKSDSINTILNKYFSYVLANKDYLLDNTYVSLRKWPHSEFVIEGKSSFLRLSTNDSLFFPMILKKADEYSFYRDIRIKTAAYFIYEVFISSNHIDKAIKKTLISKSLQLSESVSTNVYGHLKMFDSSYFNEEARTRINEVLNNDKLNEQEILLKRQLAGDGFWKVEDSIKNKKLIERYKNYSTHGSLAFKEWIDSLNYIILDKNIKNYSLINSELIDLIGNSLLYEFAPRLEQLYLNPKYEYNKKEIKLILARLQCKDYESKVLEEINAEIESGDNIESSYFQEWERNLLYLSTQKSLSIYASFLKTNLIISCDRSMINGGNINMGYHILEVLCQLIKNIPAQEFYKKEFPSLCEMSQKLPQDILETTYKWMIENVGKFQIENRNMYLH